MMKRILMFLPLAGVLAVPIVAQSNNPAGSKRELIELERQLSEALAKQDAAVLDRLWSDTFVFTSPNGQVSNKAKRLAAQRTSSTSNQLTNNNEEVEVQFYGNAAVVTVRSRWQGKTPTGELNDPYQSTHVWVKQRGRWQLVAAHVSQIKN